MRRARAAHVESILLEILEQNGLHGLLADDIVDIGDQLQAVCPAGQAILVAEDALVHEDLGALGIGPDDTYHFPRPLAVIHLEDDCVAHRYVGFILGDCRVDDHGIFVVGAEPAPLLHDGVDHGRVFGQADNGVAIAFRTVGPRACCAAVGPALYLHHAGHRHGCTLETGNSLRLLELHLHIILVIAQEVGLRRVDRDAHGDDGNEERGAQDHDDHRAQQAALMAQRVADGEHQRALHVATREPVQQPVDKAAAGRVGVDARVVERGVGGDARPLKDREETGQHRDEDTHGHHDRIDPERHVQALRAQIDQIHDQVGHQELRRPHRQRDGQ